MKKTTGRALMALGVAVTTYATYSSMKNDEKTRALGMDPGPNSRVLQNGAIAAACIALAVWAWKDPNKKLGI